MIKNIVFDLGGVVLDWSPKKVEEEFGGNRELVHFLFKSTFFGDYWTEFDRGTVSEEEIIRQMASFSGFLVAECRELVEFVKHSLVDIPRTVELIRELSEKGYKLYCLSNMSVEFYDYLKEREVFGYFDGQVISALVGMVKPEKEIYGFLLKQYGLQAKESLFIDDLLPNIEAAAVLGFQTVLFADKEKGYREINNLLQACPVAEVRL